MLFKSMEIYGFKSFPDKTVLNFDTKMTAVVGSNGNGKSNISDALRWVMGEQGVKSLRGDRMEDVIFHGTVRRKAMGFAKVSLTIDNSDRTLRIDSDEVVITRKLYRSGESEYLINGNKSLLKNINDMFMGTGLGRDGYSVIGQGKVAEIVESNGAKRREVFEEAAGVSKFLAQKKDAEGRLKKTEDNLLRIRDIADELGQRIPVLEKQAEKAKKAKVLLDREEALDISVSVYELNELEKTAADIEDKLLLNSAQCENFDRDIKKLEQEEEEKNTLKLQLRAKLEQLKAGDAAAKEKISDIKAQIAVLENDIAHADEQIKTLEKQINDGKAGKEKLLCDKELLLKQISDKNNEKTDLQAELEALEKRLTEQSEKDSALDAEYKELDKAQGQLYLKKTQAQLRLEQMNDKASSDGNRKAELNATLEEINEKIKAQKEQISKTETELEEQKERRQEAENKLKGLKLLYENKENKLKNARLNIEGLKKDHDAKRSRYDVLSDINKNMAGFMPSVKSVMGAAKQGMLSGVRGTVADIISVDKRYTIAVEIALGGVLQNVVTENEDAAKRCMRYLKDNNLGRATFLPLTSVKGRKNDFDGLSDEEGFEGMACDLVGYDAEYDGIIKFALGKTAVVDDIDTASYIAKKYGYKFRIVTLDGQIINVGGSFTGGSVKTDSGIISRKQELQVIGEEIKRLSDKIKQETELMKPLSAETAKMSIEIEGFSETLAECEPVIARLEAQLDGVNKLIAQLRQQRDMTEDALEKQELSEVQLAQQIKDAVSEIDAVNADIEKNEKVLDKQKARIDLAGESRKETADKISALNLRILNTEKDIETLDIRVQNIDESVSALENGGEEQRRQILQANRLIEEKKERISDCAQLSARIAENAGVNEREIEANISQSNTVEQRMSEIHKSIRELTEEKEKFSAELARYEERRNSAGEQTEKIISALWDKYELTKTEAKEKAELPEDIISAKNELGDIKRRITALGNVNYSSIEELEEVNERYGVLAKQLKDVEHSKRELEQLIDNLTNDIKERFNNSFDTINEYFGKLFSEIFGGGEARLELSDPEDVLNSDVDIYAAPPGKVVKSLTLLSGGEKAMVALTIYLAILKFRPTPFCMLDEVDAALDEVNVQKYAKYLKRFSHNTQLMVITHRRGTIELCDILYGVFMQEKGVSGLLRQEITDNIEQDGSNGGFASA